MPAATVGLRGACHASAAGSLKLTTLAIGGWIVFNRILLVGMGLAMLAGSVGAVGADPVQASGGQVMRGTGWGYFRSYYTRQAAVSDGENAVRTGQARAYQVYPHRSGNGQFELWLLDHN